MTHPLATKVQSHNILSLFEYATPEHCFDSEVLESVRFAYVEDALCAMLDESVLSACGNVRAYLQDQQVFLTVDAYRRMSASGRSEDWTEGQVAWLRDGFCDEYADEEGDDRLTDEQLVELTARMRAVVDWYIQHAHVYPCESVRRWTFGREDLLELVAVLRPAWLTG